MPNGPHLNDFPSRLLALNGTIKFYYIFANLVNAKKRFTQTCIKKKTYPSNSDRSFWLNQLILFCVLPLIR